MMKHFILIVLVVVSTTINLCAQTILGVDVYHGDGTITWPQVKTAGYVFGWAKATEGVSLTDANFLTNMANGANAGVIVGAYHFANPVNNSAADEAQYFLSVAGPYIGHGFMPPVLDLEGSITSEFTSAAITTWVQQWMTAVQTQTGIAPIIYTNGSIASYLNSSLNTYKLWMADPDNSATTPPSNTGVWNDWAFKQYSWYGTVPGINTGANVDLDVFNGDMTAFNILIGADVIPPVTTINVSGNWQTQNFTANFTDNDNTGGSGIDKKYYQVIDYDGTEWHANAQNGFFADNFDSFNTSVWSVPSGSGTWNVAGGNLIQSDTSVDNTNIYTSLNQNLSNRYIYDFYEKMDAATYSNDEHRFGIHFFCDTASETNRGNSYFIYFRQETHSLEFFKVVNNTFTQTKVNSNVVTNFGQWYDCQVIFDRTIGKIDVYRDNIFLDSWTDPVPLTTAGNYISFRTGNCKAYINELKVYRSRYPTVNITVGAAATNDIRYQNPAPGTYAAKIKSIVSDGAGNLSSIAFYNLNIDWTSPLCVTVNDGSGNDIDTTSSLTALSANWTASTDSNSDIVKYRYAIGTTAGATDVVNWTDNALNTSVTKSGLSLTTGQTYYFSVKAENGAGLISVCSSDGAVAEINTSISENENNVNISAQPNPFNSMTTVFFTKQTEQPIRITLTDMLGREILLSNSTYTIGKNSFEINADELNLAKGIYTLKMSSEKASNSIKLIKY